MKPREVPPSENLRTAREIEASGGESLREVRLGILATFTTTTLAAPLVVEGARRGLFLRPTMAPFGQLEQQAFDSQSVLHAGHPDVVLVALRLEDCSPALAERFLQQDPAGIDEEIEGIGARVEGLIRGLREKSSAAVLVTNFAAPESLAAGMADAGLAVSQASVVQRANDRLATACRLAGGARILDVARLAAEHGIARWSDPKLWYLGRIPFGVEAQAHLASEIARAIHALVSPAAKCLALDLDNTLWGGVLGEEGLAGIQLGEDYPGNVFKAFQRELRALRDRGILLAVCSKNNEAEAVQALESHPDGILRRGDFAALRINWKDKPTNLREIAQELSIGTDALAFFDDSPVEREWVRREMPEVRVIDVPVSPAAYVRALRESEAFDRLDLTPEDRGRAEQYRVERARSEQSRQAGSVEEFLRDLETVAEIGVVGSEQLPRVAQLHGKTNQFNLTTRRHTEAAIAAMQARGAIALWMRIADRFGDSGLVGAAIAVPEDSEARIDTFLLSCRVIGREAELALLSVLLSALRQRGVRRVRAEYLRTERNSVAADFFSRAGFEARDPEGRLWEKDLGRPGPSVPVHVRLKLDPSVPCEPDRAVGVHGAD